MPIILLVNLPVSIRNPRTSFPPLPLLVLGGCLRNLCTDGMDFTYELVDFDLMLKQDILHDDPSFYTDTVKILESKKPTACFMTVHGANLPIVLQLCQKLKDCLPDCTTVLGGVSPTLQAQDIISTFAFIDLVIQGEAETALPKLVPRLLSDRDYSKVPSAVFRKDGKVVQNERVWMRPEDPFTRPDYSIIDLAPYLANNKMHPYIAPGLALVESGRGCKWNCAFCGPNRMWGRKVRYRPIGEIAEEMLYLKSKGFDYIFFTQDNLEEEFIIKLCQYLIYEKIDMLWGGYSRLDQLSIETGTLMAQAGCRLIFAGFESPVPSSQFFIRKKIDIKPVIHKLVSFNSAGISFIVSLIAGFPGESEEELNATMRLAIECSAGRNLDELKQFVNTTGFPGLPQKRNNFCAIHPLAHMPGTDSSSALNKQLRITPYSIHHDVFGTYLLRLDDFIKQYWRIVGMVFITHMDDEKLKFYVSNLRVFDFLNGKPYQFVHILNKFGIEPLDLTKNIVEKISADKFMKESEETIERLIAETVDKWYGIKMDFEIDWA